VRVTQRQAADPPQPGEALPCEWYFEDWVLEREREQIFERSWQCVGLAGQLIAPGDYLTAQVGRVPVVVVRDERCDLRGFVNVCRHRCSLIAHGAGHRKKLQCPYHGWTYDLDGRLVAAPRFHREAGFDFAAFRLSEVQVDRLGPLVMVNTGPEAVPLTDQLGGLIERMADDGLQFDGLVHAGHWENEQAANWKVLVENFNECYHCPVAHPDFSRLLAVDPDHYRLETSRWTSRAVVPLRAGGVNAVDGYPDGENDKGQYALLWPSFTLSQSPGPRRVVACWFEPVTAERTRMVCETFVDPRMSPAQVAALDRFSMQVTAEDQRLVESVQQGLRSRRVPRAHLMLDSERLVDHFDRLVCAALTQPDA
jgi:phenylpropionate dioxygenase-like ring-hydroxylating dioxygenase large terminal subunit